MSTNQELGPQKSTDIHHDSLHIPKVPGVGVEVWHHNISVGGRLVLLAGIAGGNNLLCDMINTRPHTSLPESIVCLVFSKMSYCETLAKLSPVQGHL